ncbi:MAG: glycosyltransferase [Planctomycetes bacterium]|nr:glycosyltransferase [Planctomycetota bacterium]
MSRGLAVFVGDVDVVGGSERQALLLARTLTRRGVPVDVLTCTSPGPLRLPRRWAERRDGARLVRLPRLLLEPAAGALLAPRRGDLRGLHGVGLMMGVIAARVGRALDLPVTVKLAGAGAAGDMVALARLPAPDRARVLADLRRTHLVCVSEEVAAEALAAGVEAERVVRIPNGVDLGPDVAQADPGAAPTVLFVGRLDPAKGADDLLRAFARLAGGGARLVLAGDGPERPALERLARDLGVADRVDLLGRRDDVPALLRGATVVAVPSRSEGLSNALLEALAAGCAVVATAIGPNREAAGDAALLAPPGDVAALAGALARARRPRPAAGARRGRARPRRRLRHRARRRRPPRALRPPRRGAAARARGGGARARPGPGRRPGARRGGSPPAPATRSAPPTEGRSG